MTTKQEIIQYGAYEKVAAVKYKLLNLIALPIFIIGCTSPPVQNSKIEKLQAQEIPTPIIPEKEFSLKKSNKIISASTRNLLNQVFRSGDWSMNCKNKEAIHYRFFDKVDKYILIQVVNMLPITGAEIYYAKNLNSTSIELKINAIESNTNNEYVQSFVYGYETNKLTLKKSSVLFMKGALSGKELTIYPEYNDRSNSSDLLNLKKLTSPFLNYCGSVK